MMTTRYMLRPVQSRMEWRENKETMKFRRTRVKKTMRKRGNAAVNVLKQMGWLKPDQFQVETVHSIEVDWRRLDEFIIRHCHDILRRFNRQGMTLVMGCGDFEKLIGCVQFAQEMRFDLSVVGTRQFRGMTVVVLPWMEGFTCIPREYLPIETKTVVKEVPESDETKKRKEGERAAAEWNAFMGRPPL